MFYVEERFSYNPHTPYLVFDNTHGKHNEHPIACFSLRSDAENFVAVKNKFCSIKDTKGYMAAYKAYKAAPSREDGEDSFLPAHKCEECGEDMDSAWKIEGGEKIGGVCVRCERELCGECGGFDELGLCKRCVEIEEAEEHESPEESKKLSLRTRLEAAKWRHEVFLENERNNRENFGKRTTYKKVFNEGGEAVRIGANIGEGVECVELCISGYPTLKIPVWLFPALGEAFDVMRGSAGEPLPVGWEEDE